ncbi:hypothetical protein PI124_g24515 [Phytophthora idaei]|nr:hypothetical protein PI124_g24515 [Phytophthora idaei]
MDDNERTSSSELVMKDGYGKAVDWWALGILAYEMIQGDSPFRHNVPTILFNKILKEEPVFSVALHTYSGIGFGGEVAPNLEAISDALGIHGARSVGTERGEKGVTGVGAFSSSSLRERSDHLHGVDATL